MDISLVSFQFVNVIKLYVSVSFVSLFIIFLPSLK